MWRRRFEHDVFANDFILVYSLGDSDDRGDMNRAWKITWRKIKISGSESLKLVQIETAYTMIWHS
jgi:hypothetical protein